MPIAMSMVSRLQVTAVLVFAVVACGGDDGRLSVAAYFDAVDQAEVSDEQYTAVVEAASARQGALEFADLAAGFADDLSGLDPPTELEELHAELTASVEEAATLLRDRAGELDEGSEPHLLQTLLAEDSEVLAAIRRVDDALIALQAAADERGVEVSLASEDSFTPDAGADAVVIEAVEFEFAFDEDAFVEGITGVALVNEGEQPHEISVALVPEDFDVEYAVNSPEIEDVQELGFTLAQPGEQVELGFGSPLGPGHYALVCFVEDPASAKTHAQLGMFAEVTIP